MKHTSILFILLQGLWLSAFAQHKLLTAENGDRYLAGVVNLKIAEDHRSACTETAVAIPDLLQQFELWDFRSLKKKFPGTLPPDRTFNTHGLRLADISLIYELHIGQDHDPVEVARKLSALPQVVYAEPQFVSYDMYIPNDANLNNVMPYHFDKVNAYEAWDITLGDTNVVIGITETSMDVNHEDLSANVKYNYVDPPGNGDEDADSYTDNFAGWDVVDNDNNLFVNNEIHGTAVAAIASASADNGIGYAGIGFKCKFLPVKVANSSQVITHGYEGIQYCVEHGCSVINCSWGNTTFSQVAQDVVTWAAVNNDVVLVASAGNASSTNFYYPASYNHVLSVTGVDQNDLFDNGSNPTFTYNDSVDVSAPGINIYTTATFNGQYLYAPPQGGTSMASPIVAGIAALVRAKFPCLTALEVIEQIKATTDPIDGLAQNIPYAGMIGTGRVNAQAAVTGNLCDPLTVSERNAVYVEVYPNPATDHLTIATNSTGIWQVDIVDMEGRVVRSELLRGTSLLLHGLPNGIYVAKVSNNERLFCKRFSIVRH